MNMKKRYILGISFVLCLMLAMVGIVEAIEWDYDCYEDDLVATVDMTTCKTDASGTTCKTYDINNTVDCVHGCDNVTKTCMPPMYQSNLWIIGFAVVMLCVVGFMLKKYA